MHPLRRASLQTQARLGNTAGRGAGYAGGVRFVLYPQDHVPRYAYGLAGNAESIVDRGWTEPWPWPTGMMRCADGPRTAACEGCRTPPRKILNCSWPQGRKGMIDRHPALNRPNSMLSTPIDAAIVRHSAWQDAERRTVRAGYNHPGHKLWVTLFNGVTVLIPPELLRGLQSATWKKLGAAKIVGSGPSVRWPVLHVDHLVSELLRGVFGTRRWMATIGRQGGQSWTGAKRSAARSNGRRGGRRVYRGAGACTDRAAPVPAYLKEWIII